MTKLYLIPGHGQGDSGAVGGGYTEADLVRRLATRIRELGGGEVETSDYSLNCYANSGMMNWSFPDGAQVVELHMDSADPSAHGAHVIYKAGYSPDAYDVALAERLFADDARAREHLGGPQRPQGRQPGGHPRRVVPPGGARVHQQREGQGVLPVAP